MGTESRAALSLVDVASESPALRILTDLVVEVERLPEDCSNCDHFALVHATVLRKVDQVSRLIAAIRLLTATTDLEQIMRVAAERARSLLDAKVAGLLLLTGDGPEVEAVQLSGFAQDPGLALETLPAIRLACAERKLVRAARLDAGSEAAGRAGTSPLDGPHMVAPLIAEGAALGTLFVGRDAQVAPFGEEEEALLLSLAAQVASAVQNARLCARSRELSLLQERQRLAQLLHNTVVQSLFTIGLEAKWCLEHGALDSDVQRRLRAIYRLGNASSCQLRGAIHALTMPFASGETGIVDLLREQVADFQSRTSIAASLIAPPELPAIAPDLAEGIYRIVCESLANVQKHALASAVLVALRHEDQRLVITVQDDGVGLPASEGMQTYPDGMHFGVAMMRQLAEQLHGEFEIHDADGGGVMVRAVFETKQEMSA